MPDGYLDKLRAQQAAARAEAAAIHPIDDDRHLSRDEIDHCRLCDSDGYRGVAVCDHIDHRAAAKRGIALVRAALEAIEAKGLTS